MQNYKKILPILSYALLHLVAIALLVTNRNFLDSSSPSNQENVLAISNENISQSN